MAHRSSVPHAGSEAKVIRTTADSLVAHIPVLGRESGKIDKVRRWNYSADAEQYIIRSSNKKPRLKSKLYIFNSFGMIGKSLGAFFAVLEFADHY
jgi:hypothetical protein